MDVLMLVWTGVATDTRVLREARALVAAGHRVHIIGRAVPEDFVPPAGVTVGSAGRPPAAQERTRSLTAPERLARWALLPVHVGRRLAGWQAETRELALRWAADHGAPHVVHVHDFTALAVGAALADEWRVPYVYDTHEYWVGRPVAGRPAPVRRRREARIEDRLGAGAAAVLTVGQGVADALRRDHPAWPEITIVRNTFPLVPDPAPVASPPTAFVYAGRLAADRELETIAAAAPRVPGDVVLRGPADEEWLRRFAAGPVRIEPARPLPEVDRELVAAGAALVTHSDRWDNYRLALPNKLFHAVSLGVPVVATDVGELAALVRAHRLGTLYPPGDAAGLAAACRALAGDHAAYLAGVAAARRELSWERDARALVGAYDALGTRWV